MGRGYHYHLYEWQRICLEIGQYLGHKWMLRSADGIKIAKLELATWGTHGTITVVSDAPSPAELNLLIFAGWTQYLFEMQAAAAA